MIELTIPDIQDMNIELLTRKKIEYVHHLLPNRPFFVEHTGLIVDAWNGLPGGLTGQFMDTVGYAGICKMLEGYKDEEHMARIKTVLGYSYNKNIHIFEGSVTGRITEEPRGNTGFTFDHIFIPEGCSQTYAELGSEIKNQISMRRRAANSFAQYLAYHFEYPLEIVQSINPNISRRSEKGKDTFNNMSDSTIKILFLAANPRDSIPLRLDEEMRAIDQVLRQSEYRDRFEVRQHWAIRTTDLQSFFLRYKPHIVHFSGHGSAKSEIILEDNTGKSHPVSPRAMSNLFSVLKDNIKCVVLNACYSESQAQAVAKHIDCVVGMSKAIGDRSAIAFAASFYQALAYGRDMKTAFDLGCLQIDMENLNEQDIPKLLTHRSDPSQIMLIDVSTS
jgi:non-canonical purine NTP pyrophosphatase (RdgB/HAM1 family)